MKDRNGFTFVELILAIVLLGIVSYIAIININKNSNNQKKDSYNKLVSNVLASADAYVNDNGNLLYDLYNNKNYVYIKVGVLIDNGYLDENTINPYTKKVINREELIKIYYNSITATIEYEYPVKNNEKMYLNTNTLNVTIDSEFNCLDGIGSDDLVFIYENGTYNHIGDTNYNLNNSVISERKLRCSYDTRLTKTTNKYTSGEYQYNSYRASLPGTYVITYTWDDNNGKEQTTNRNVIVSEKKYLITYHPNGGNFGYQTKIISPNESLNDYLGNATKEGYQFKNWSLNPNGTSIVNKTDKYTFGRNIDLYAQYSACSGNTISNSGTGYICTSCNLHYHANSSHNACEIDRHNFTITKGIGINKYYVQKPGEGYVEYSNSSLTISVPYNSQVNVYATTVTGYEYEHSSSSNPLKFTITSNTTHTLEGTPKVYNIIYKLGNDKASNYKNAPKNYTYRVGATIDGTPTLDKYKFFGWRFNESDEPQSSIKISSNATGNKNVYATWCRKCNSISNGSCSVSFKNQKCTYKTTCDSGYIIQNNGEYNASCIKETTTQAQLYRKIEWYSGDGCSPQHKKEEYNLYETCDTCPGHCGAKGDDVNNLELADEPGCYYSLRYDPC